MRMCFVFCLRRDRKFEIIKLVSRCLEHLDAGDRISKLFKKFKEISFIPLLCLRDPSLPTYLSEMLFCSLDQSFYELIVFSKEFYSGGGGLRI